MKIEKLPSGSYRIQKQIEGKRYSITFDHKPTQKEIITELSKRSNSVVTLKNAPNKTFEDCANKYIEVKTNVLSASTIRSYKAMLKKIDDSFKKTLLSDIDQLQIQQLINDMSADRTPKTIRNYHALIVSVINMFVPELTFNTTLPKAIKTTSYIPTSEDVKAVLSASNDKYYIVFMLGCYGLRRSEILPLQWPNDFDLENNLVHINKAMVQNDNKEWIVQPFNKTTESKRDVPIPKDLIDRIAKQGYVFQGYPDKIIEYLNRKQDQLGIPRFKFHSLRHYFATELDQAGFSSKDIQKLGGWSSDHILKTVYQHNRVEKDKEIQKKAAATIIDKLQ